MKSKRTFWQQSQLRVARLNDAINGFVRESAGIDFKIWLSVKE